MTLMKTVAVFVLLVALGFALPQPPSPGNLINPENLLNLLPNPPPIPFALPPHPLQQQHEQEHEQQQQDESFYDPFAYPTSEFPPIQHSGHKPTTERPTTQQNAVDNELAIDEANPPCKQDSDCLCHPAWTFCLLSNETGSPGRCALRCHEFCGNEVACQIEPEVAPSKDLTCHLDLSRIKCSQSKRGSDDDDAVTETENPILSKSTKSAKPEPVYVPTEFDLTDSKRDVTTNNQKRDAVNAAQQPGADLSTTSSVNPPQSDKKQIIQSDVKPNESNVTVEVNAQSTTESEITTQENNNHDQSGKNGEKNSGEPNEVVDHKQEPGESNEAVVDNDKQEVGNEKFSRAIHRFSQNMLVEISQDVPDNLVISPFSLHTALAMLTSGATVNSTTQNQLLAAMGDIDDFEDFQKHYIELLQDYEKNVPDQLSVGNKIWTTESIKPNIYQSYIDHLKGSYQTDLGVLAKANPEVEVNKWINKTTKGKIPKIVDSVDKDTVLMLTNAIYFKEAWKVAFTKVEGGNKNFTLSNGQVVGVPMMQRSSHEIVTARFNLTDFLPDAVFQSVAIPYASDNGRFQLIIIMAEKPENLNLLLKPSNFRQSSNDLLKTVTNRIDEADSANVERSVVMPIFTVKSDIKVAGYLKKLGVLDAFGAAEFGLISKDVELKVSAVTHVATVEVTTEGTVGAAATGVEIAPFSGLFEQPQEVVINKPFIFSIRDRTKGTVLFIGKVMDPTKQ